MRIAFGFVAAAALGSAVTLASTGAQAGCCNTWPFFQPFGGYARPQVVYAQPQPVQPQVVYVQPVPPQPVVVKVQPQVIVLQPQPVVPAYQVNQGPVYSGPGADWSPAVYEPAVPVPAYPYFGLRRWHHYRYAHRPRPYVSAYRYPPHRLGHPHGPIYRKY